MSEGVGGGRAVESVQQRGGLLAEEREDARRGRGRHE